MKYFASSFFIITLSLLLVSSVFAAPAMRVSEALWANDKLFDTVLTDTSFNLPPMHSTDVLYNFGISGLQGQRAVSASAPGDRDYNGGRWSVKVVVFTEAGKAAHDPDGDKIANFELTSADAVLAHQALGHFDIIDTSIYFECPLLPRKNTPGH
jgi:hypothetical protein